MLRKFQSIINRLVSSGDGVKPLTGIEIGRQFRPTETDPKSMVRNLNAAFLISLCGNTHSRHEYAENFIKDLKNQVEWRDAAAFYEEGLSLIYGEIEERCAANEEFRDSLELLYDWFGNPENLSDRMETINRVWGVFFPEGVSLFEKKNLNMESLRKKRRIKIHRLKADPIRDPAGEILFTSNVLMTLPSPSTPMERLPLGVELKARLKEIKKEDQLYWYDHPIQIGVETSGNEVVYGLAGLNQTIAFEKERGTVEKDTKLSCVLSVSVTHAGLKGVAKSCLEEMFKDAEYFEHLRIFAFTEADTSKIVRDILKPAAAHYLDSKDDDRLQEIIGVDGEYGRHYSFLKAIAAFWQIFLDPRIKATFKIDLDQVFPQEELVSESGGSALEHFKTPLWGAEGEEQDGTLVELGMLAGALVNGKDIAHSLFTPDVGYPDESISGDQWIFFSALPQALSTESEMMTRYGEDTLDGEKRCIQRFHVTGGTCGILVESLRRHRPFTPGFIGRAEDQAYLLSVLFKEAEGNLRYVHKDGLVMRHDKEEFAEESIRFARTGKLIGDYIRILLFSYYGRALPWSLEKTKRLIDPFTGCFISHIPFTVAYLRLALKGASFFKEGRDDEGFDTLRMGFTRLYRVIRELAGRPDSLKDRYLAEKQAWDIYYDLLDKVEKGLKEKDPFALELKNRAVELVRTSEVNLGTGDSA